MHTTYQRRCVACRQPHLKQEMVRITKVNGDYVIDETYKLNGRSAYICKNKECITKVIDKKLLNRSFKTNLNEIYSNLRGYIE